MKTQSYKINKLDWLVTVRTGIKTTYFYSATLKGAREVGRRRSKPKSEVQIFKVSYEFRDAYEVSDPRAVKAKMKKNKK